MPANALRVIGWVEDPDTYPIQPKPDIGIPARARASAAAHQRDRRGDAGTAQLGAAIHHFFDENGFFWVNRPAIAASGAEGAGALLRVSTLVSPTCRAPQRARSISRRISLAARRS
jgi:asparaginyl-tRNA synthetase